MSAEKKEITKFEQALDLKAKVSLLLKACSEVTNYLSTKADSIQKIDGQVNDAAGLLEAAAKEKEAMDKALQSIKVEYENKKRELADMKESTEDQISQIRRDAIKDRDEAHTTLINANAKEAEASALFEQAAKLRKELEEKLTAIQKIGGK